MSEAEVVPIVFKPYFVEEEPGVAVIFPDDATRVEADISDPFQRTILEIFIGQEEPGTLLSDFDIETEVQSRGEERKFSYADLFAQLNKAEAAGWLTKDERQTFKYRLVGSYIIQESIKESIKPTPPTPQAKPKLQAVPDIPPKAPPKKQSQPSPKRREERQQGTGKNNEKDDDLVHIYLEGISKYMLLTKDDEVRLAKLIESGREAQTKLDVHAAAKKAGQKVLSAAEVKEQNRAVRLGNNAKKDFVNSNLRLVVSIAKRYQNLGLPLMDLIQEGNIGLMHAVDLFQWRKGFKFSTYATPWVRQHIHRSLANTASTIRRPVHMIEKIRQYEVALAKLWSQEGHPSDEVIANYIMISVEEVGKIREAKSLANPVCLDEPVSQDTSASSSIGDGVADPSSQRGYEQTEKKALFDDFLDLLRSSLDERELHILYAQNGLLDGRSQTLEEIGRKFDLSGERVRQIGYQAKKKVRAIFAADPKLRELKYGLIDLSA